MSEAGKRFVSPDVPPRLRHDFEDAKFRTGLFWRRRNRLQFAALAENAHVVVVVSWIFLRRSQCRPVGFGIGHKIFDSYLPQLFVGLSPELRNVARAILRRRQ